MNFFYKIKTKLALCVLIIPSCEMQIASCGIEDADIVDEMSVLDVLHNRASQIAEIKWTPLADIPKQGGFYTAGNERTGLPYSSVKETEKFVGQYVSLYTFMTAVANPKSVLYTENVSKPPYHGTNCSTYYGTVCSMAVNYVLGLPYSFTTSDYKSLECFTQVVPATIESLQSGDLLLRDKKHVVMVLDILEKGGQIDGISILESAGGMDTRIRSYTVAQIMDRWKRDGWEILRYKYIDSLATCESMTYNNYPYNSQFNSPICCSLGDRACYREGEPVVLNNIDGDKHRFTLKMGRMNICNVSTNGTDHQLLGLRPGIYILDFSNTSITNPSFEVLDTQVSAQIEGDEIEVTFSSSNGKPTSVILSTITGVRKSITILTDADRDSGKKKILKPVYNGQLYVKVTFEGKYGCVINDPVLIQ